MFVEEEDYLEHYGILRRSGRYPWGSGGNVQSRSADFLSRVAALRKDGLTDTEIAKGFGMTTTELRATNSIARNEKRAADITMAERLKAKGYSNGAIAKRMNLPGESSVRALLAPGLKDRADSTKVVADVLKQQVDTRGYIDVGVGSEYHLPVSASRTKLDTALAMLKSDGYEVINVQIDQLGTGNKTLVKVLAPAGTKYRDIVQNKDKIQTISAELDENGKVAKALPPLSINSNRVQVRYAEDGGADADGVIYVRPGVEDVSLGGSRYAQVRIAVDGTHYLKGMAVYKDDLPDGVDLQFNTNKSNTGNKLDALKKVSDDPTDPFGAITRPGQIVKDAKGKERVTSVMNIVNEEGNWEDWSKSLASQMLSKQRPTLAKEQLAKTFKEKQAEYEEIMSLTNPSVRKRLLESFADDADSSAVHLQAAAMPNQATQVILPVNSMKTTEIYAPNFKNGERVALIRYPHGGTFEIPELVVNNRNAEGRKLLGDAKDAVGIHSKVAERLSGADFDGDSVLVIPNSSGKIKSTPALERLKGFDPKNSYPAYEGMPKMTDRQKQVEMGKVSNLITDMTIKGANPNEIARAVKHSMVVIDAEKHNLNYKQSAIDNGIAQLKEKYQGGANKGASTLVSRSTSEERVPRRKMSFRIDPKTGEKIYIETGESYVKTTVNKKTGAVRERVIPKTTKTTQGAEAKDAHTLSSGTPIEKIYADHANRLKALANQARKEMVATKNVPYSPSAKKTYAKEVSTLNAKLNVALKNAPLERKAQLIANSIVKAKRDSNPNATREEIKKIEGKALIEARARIGARKTRVDITDNEWEAIQAGAISPSRLSKILTNTDLDRVKKLATPRQARVMTTDRIQRAKQLLASGRTQAEVAEILGVGLTTLKSNIK